MINVHAKHSTLYLAILNSYNLLKLIYHYSIKFSIKAQAFISLSVEIQLSPGKGNYQFSNSNLAMDGYMWTCKFEYHPEYALLSMEGKMNKLLNGK